MFTPLTDRVVIITGASKGIGRGISFKFAEHGAKLLLINRNESEGNLLIQQLKDRGHQANSFSADVSSEDLMLAAADYAEKTFGHVDIICANAGIYPCQKIESISMADWDKVMDINLKGTFITIKSFLPLLKKSIDGRIVLTSSITGPVTGFPGWTHYGASKAGQLGFMRSAALELAPYGITVNSILPGNIKTEGVIELGEEHIASMAKSIPLNKLGDVDHIANTALFLASKEAGFITGQTIIVDGGQTLPETLDQF
ncbi:MULTISPECIES: 3-oxoacyl-ACP reductase FabG [unclassified Legionella]|uniref:3-oxoacyl-ACP reductase FabG n=1 Tax=unclassified Legionella TaxID=2622702 RepID=UPI001054C39F|nr:MULTISPECIES: 3-oxoacyl-ACP reductase FabG [unclassified Legionella]MDI9819456.1 3-oxoacyl-ACP reductase FabG [Legionella sp. PL877]